MNAEALGKQLRQGTGPFLKERRTIAGLSLASIGSLALISLYQVGIIPHLPEPPLPYFDADKVNGSAQAYAKLHTPDAILGIGSYAATMTLAMMGAQERFRERPWLPLALAGKVALDTVLTAQLLINELTKQKALCFWCLLVSAATLGTVPMVIPEAKAAVAQLCGHSK
ncbi:MAG: vitamin K epoxide reductase family protein [Chloroflexota bacterium]